jgi:hypothetical protein
MRLNKSTNTPAAHAAEVRRFTMLAEPPVRAREVEDGRPVTFGDMLDCNPDSGSCRHKYATHSQSTNFMSMRTAMCGTRMCPRCVVGWLAERVAPCWAYWGGEAVLLEDASGLRLRGPNAQPGILSATFTGGSWAFAPSDVDSGQRLRGVVLDGELMRLLRDLPLEPEPSAADRRPNDGYMTIPDQLGTEELKKLAAEAGGAVVRIGHRFGVEIDRAGFLELKQAIWGARLRPAPLRPAPDEARAGQVSSAELNRRAFQTQPARGPKAHETVSLTEGARNEISPTKNLEETVELVTTPETVANPIRCSRCDSPDWHGWLHDRGNWNLLGGAYRDVMIRAHFAFGCGLGGVAYEREGDYLYPTGYLAMAGAA